MNEAERTAVGRTARDPFGKQAVASQYSTPAYLSPERLSSIGYQFELASQSSGQSFLNVGSSHGLLEMLLKRAGLRVVAVDLDPELNPDIVGVLPFLPLGDMCVDVSMAFQVLEHMPFELIRDGLLELRRVARTYVIISLPDQTPFFPPPPTTSRLEALALRFYQWTWARQEWRFRKSTIVDPEHFWEIGNPGITTQTIVDIGSAACLEAMEVFRNPHFPYHAFFVFARVPTDTFTERQRDSTGS